MSQSGENILMFERFRKGDKIAFAHLFKAYKERIYLYALAYLNNELEAEDLTQEVFTALWQEFQERDNKILTLDHMMNWLYTISRHKCLNVIRRSRSKMIAYEEIKREIEPTTVVNDYELLYSEYINRIKNEIAKLPEQIRDVFIMRHIKGLSPQEVAQRMHLDIDTVYVYSKRALKKLRGKLIEQFPETVILMLIYCISIS